MKNLFKMSSIKGAFYFRGFITIFSGKTTGFPRQAKRFWTELLYKEKVYLDGQTRRAKLSLEPLAVPSAQPLLKPVHFFFGGTLSENFV